MQEREKINTAVVHTGDILYCTNTHLALTETEAVRCIFKSNNTGCTLREQGDARRCRGGGGGGGVNVVSRIMRGEVVFLPNRCT